MISLALKNNKWVKLDTWESQQPQWPLTLDALDYHKQQLDSLYCNKVELMFLCGADLFETINVANLWRNDHVQQICIKYGIIVVKRIGFDPEKVIEHNEILSKYKVRTSTRNSLNRIERQVKYFEADYN